MRLLHLVGQGHHSMTSQASMTLLRGVVHELRELRRCAQGSIYFEVTINNKPASSLIMVFVSPYEVSSILQNES